MAKASSGQVPRSRPGVSQYALGDIERKAGERRLKVRISSLRRLFATRLLAQRPISCFLALPSSIIAAIWECSPSVVIALGEPRRLIAYFMKASAACLSRVQVM